MRLQHVYCDILTTVLFISAAFAAQNKQKVELTEWDGLIIKSCQRKEIDLLRKNLRNPKMKPAVIGYCISLFADTNWDKATLILNESKHIKFHPKYLENALLKASNGHSTPLLHALLAAGADPSTHNSLPLSLAIKSRIVPFIDVILTDPRVNPAVEDNLLYKSLPVMEVFREMWDHPSAPLKQLGSEFLKQSLVEDKTACLIDLISHPQVDKSGIEELAERTLLNGPHKGAELVLKTIPLLEIISNNESDLTPDQYAELLAIINSKEFENPYDMVKLWERSDILILLLKASLASTKNNLVSLLLNSLPFSYHIKNEEKTLKSILTRAVSLDNVQALDILLRNTKFSTYKTSPMKLEKLAKIISQHNAPNCAGYFVRGIVKISKRATFWLDKVAKIRAKITEADFNLCAYNHIINQLYSVANNELRNYPFTSKLFKNMVRNIAAADALLLATPLPADCHGHILEYLK